MNQCPRGPETNNKDEVCVSAWPLGSWSCVMKCDSGVICCLVTLQKVRRRVPSTSGLKEQEKARYAFTCTIMK